MNIMYKHIYLNFGVISFINKEMVTFIQLHTYKFGLVYIARNKINYPQMLSDMVNEKITAS